VRLAFPALPLQTPPQCLYSPNPTPLDGISNFQDRLALARNLNTIRLLYDEAEREQCMKTAGKHRATRRRRTCAKQPEKQTRSSDAASSPIVQLPVCCGRPWDDPNTRRKVKPIKPIGWTRSMPLPCLSFGVNGRTQDDFKTCISHPHQESSHTAILGTVQDAYPAGVHCPSRLCPADGCPYIKRHPRVPAPQLQPLQHFE
jgi:hypothetical protein